MLVETVYRYPRRITWLFELLSGLAVAWALVGVVRVLLLLLWQRWPLDAFILKHIPRLPDFVAWVQRSGPRRVTYLSLLEPLGWLLAILFAALIIRNTFPAVRFSIRGLLVWFANDWLPVSWESVRSISITDTPSGKRFAVLVQTDGSQLLPYHRLYSFLYGFRLRRGFLITSALEDGEGLMREMLEEVERRRKLGEKLNLKIEDRARSPLFGLFLNPLALFGATKSEKPVFQPFATAATLGNATALTMPSMGGAATAAPAAQARPAAPGETVEASYPRFVELGLNLLTILIGGFALWRYLAAWTTFLLFTFPSLQNTALFRSVVVGPVVSPWGVLLGAHLGLILVAGIVLMVRHLFPAVSVDSTGIVFTALGRAHRLTWEQVQFVKATDVRDESHVVLVEASDKALPWYFVMGSWLYDGGTGRGALIWPMLQPFEPLMQRIALELTRRQQPDQPVRLRDDAPGWLLLLALRPADALDRLVLMQETDEDMPRGLETAPLLRAGASMIWNALGPAVLLLTYWMMYKGIILSFQVPFMLVVATLWGITEWPLAAFLASSLDQIVGAGSKGYRGLYLYPTAQLPRLLPLALAILLTLMGFPTLAMLIWVAGIAWSGLLTAGLWEALYGWRGLALLGGSAMTIFFQLLTFLGVLALRG